MRFGRLLVLALAAGAVVWFLKTRQAAPTEQKAAPKASPTQGGAAGEMSEAAREAAKSDSGAAITENMTPGQVRALLGPPDEVQTSTSDSGKPQEKWIYRSVGKSVIFENGVVVAVR